MNQLCAAKQQAFPGSPAAPIGGSARCYKEFFALLQ
jgi:hypothetical protein